jgi:hypothetical protein
MIYTQKFQINGNDLARLLLSQLFSELFTINFDHLNEDTMDHK